MDKTIDSKHYIIVKGARENNLKNLDVAIPKDTLTVFTGLSGSGKSTLAFDTIYAEGQRRYVESLSPYARQFLGGVDKPDVDSIEGLSPAISIDQKTTSHNPRSTVATVTEIYDFLRLLFARVGVPYCPHHHIPIVATTPAEMTDTILKYKEGSRIQILAPVVKHEKGTHKSTLAKLKAQGFARLRVDGTTCLMEEAPELEKNGRHDIDIVIDRLVMKDGLRSRVAEDVDLALDWGHGELTIVSDEGEKLLSSNHSCPICGFSIPKLEPRLFSFNAPLGYCPTCKGLGIDRSVAVDLLVPDPTKTINQGAIRFYKNVVGTANLEWQEFCVLMDHYHIPYDVPWQDLSEKQRDIILFGSKEDINHVLTSSSGNQTHHKGPIEGVKTKIERLYNGTTSKWMLPYYESFMRDDVCETCHGARLNEQALSVKVNGLSIYEVTQLSIDKLLVYLDGIGETLTPNQTKIASMVLKEIRNRAKFLVDVGLDYLTLDRLAMTLSGGEAQRIRLATQIGSRLSGVLYVLDEPSIGLHERDNQKLIATLKEMRDLGNTLIVVEHDEETMRAADYLVDIGPGAGVHGGEVVAAGSVKDIENAGDSITGDYLSGRKFIPIPPKRRRGNGKSIVIKGASCHNLKNITVKFPLGEFIVVTGVSGSGKSSLINETLVKAIKKRMTGEETFPGAYKSIEGLQNIDKVVDIDQEPIGRTPRSNPATYTKLFDDIRALFAETEGARARGFDKGRFSFNVPGGRCEKCQGAGVVWIPMNFLPDVYVKCDECDGMRYNEETLACTYKGKNIHDVLEMRVEEALHFFENRPQILHRIKTLYDVGLGYIKLGQAATTLSGGESQRVKLASQLQRRPTGKTVYVLDEPTTGLHTDDVKRLVSVLQSLVSHGDTVIVIEHNLDVIKVADTIIDLGPEGGYRGGSLVVEGTPERVAECEKSYTGRYLKEILAREKEKGQIG
ncbi:MAG: excinuclease ABC subunit UvrA [Bacilli bacterium]|jgi:excinuclease ABC subunit A|nr:excinuclease ABC subunit UvrA [Bacilli bacterium]